MKSRHIAGAFSIALLLLAMGATSASALTVVRSGVASETLSFKSDIGKCKGTSTARIGLPSGARDVRVVSPQVGATSDDVQIVSVAIIQPGDHPIVSWTAEEPSCTSEFFGEEWSETFTSRVEYKLPVHVVLVRALGERMVAVSLNREFNSTFANSTEVTRFACRKGQLSMRCRVGWFIGDSSYRGTVKVKLGASAATPYWSYRVRVKVRDDYCQFVLHRPDCTKQVQRQRRGLRLGWESYERWTG